MATTKSIADASYAVHRPSDAAGPSYTNNTDFTPGLDQEEDHRRRPGHQFPDPAVSRPAGSGLPTVFGAALRAVVGPYHAEELAPVVLVQPAGSRARDQELGDGAA
ncbi:hypothetical protein BP6252_05244 [Coleophoma cylindrospora]|uniref:Uncharacterized protein n=1 Tax=Coleophoma cylindrospora TaxID=1849047 RepID=A0A3D8RTR0_9HELO|nr:hypothetical protein BP6252_05244 [Coleophoma cylindrospora]